MDDDDIARIVYNPRNLQEWQHVVDSEIWRNDPGLISQLADQYFNLARGNNVQHGQYGTGNFWHSFFDQMPGFFDDHDGDDEQMANDAHSLQVGHGDQAQEEQEANANENERPASYYYELGEMFRRSSRRFGTHYGQFNFRFRNMNEVADLEDVLMRVFAEVLEKLKSTGKDDDLISFCMMHPGLDFDKPILVPLRPQHAMDPEDIVDAILRVLQSKEDLSLDDENMAIYFTRIEKPAGAGRLKRQFNTNMADYLRKKKAIIEIKNTDELCCARAIVTAKAKLDNDRRYGSIRQGDRSGHTAQRRLAKSLMEKAGIQRGPCGPLEWVKLQDALGSSYQLKIFDKDRFNALIYAGPHAAKIIHLWLHGSHFDTITSMPAFFERVYYCEDCDKAYNNRTDHRRCPVRCNWCFEPGLCKRSLGERLIKCDKCMRYFNNQRCYDNHLKSTGTGQQATISICEQMKRCKECGKEFKARNKHKCGTRYCSICKVDYHETEDHQCFIQPLEMNQRVQGGIESDDDDEVEQDPGPSASKKASKEKRATFIFYDIESPQEIAIARNEQGEILMHTPNLVIAHKVCEVCCENQILGPCDYCKDNRGVFAGVECMDKFCEWLFSKMNNGAIALAHNAKGYDCQFILDYVHRQGLKPKQIISRGLSILMMEVGGIQFKDSLCFLPMGLAALPKAFDVNECKKGYFPHLFNRQENWNYIGTWPPIENYQPQHMKGDERQKFMIWYELQRGKEFHFQKELFAYCESDVEVLRKCCLKFRKMFLDIGQLDPFVSSITIASACNKYFRMHFLEPNRIGVIPYGGYRKEEKQSAIALRWLKWLAQTTGKYIRHKLNGGEVRINGRYRVDGICDQEIFEFNGCAYHGCPKCFPRRDQLTPGDQLTMAEAYQRTLDRRAYLEQQRYAVIEKWECELHAELKVDFEMADFFSNVKISDPLNERDAFFGGRTNATTLYHQAKNGEKIRYIDILSLYPYICKYGRFPLGHPKIVTEQFEDISADNMPYEGLIKCTVLPPNNLLHPVLPYRSKETKKLLFPLCYTCANKRQHESCQHTEEERALSGTWVSLELHKALQTGYKLMEIQEVWHYSEYEQYDQINNPNGGLFTGYINEFLKIKQEADGWPRHANTDELKAAFIEEWLMREGIQLRPEHMIKNAGLRALAKLMLNSFWGKFGQRSRMSKTEYFTDPEPYFQLVFDPRIAVKTVRIVNDNMVAVTYEQGEDFVNALSNTNAVIAAYTTAQARLKLYSYIEKLQERVLYFDTDSIIYLDRPGDQYQPEIGNFLGQMTNECEKEGPDAYISEFVSGGPKHYAMKIYSEAAQKETIIMKVKGFRIDHEASAILNFENLRLLVHAFVQNGSRTEQQLVVPRIERTKDNQVVSVKRKRVYRITLDKRIYLNDFSSIPFGYAQY